MNPSSAPGESPVAIGGVVTSAAAAAAGVGAGAREPNYWSSQFGISTYITKLLLERHCTILL
jgi:hypothetical protein